MRSKQRIKADAGFNVTDPHTCTPRSLSPSFWRGFDATVTVLRRGVPRWLWFVPGPSPGLPKRWRRPANAGSAMPAPTPPTSSTNSSPQSGCCTSLTPRVACCAKWPNQLFGKFPSIGRVVLNVSPSVAVWPLCGVVSIRMVWTRGDVGSCVKVRVPIFLCLNALVRGCSSGFSWALVFTCSEHLIPIILPPTIPQTGPTATWVLVRKLSPAWWPA